MQTVFNCFFIFIKEEACTKENKLTYSNLGEKSEKKKKKYIYSNNNTITKSVLFMI